MTEELTKVIIDCTTGEETILPLTEEEIAENLALQAETEARLALQQAEVTAREEAKASGIAKLLALGLTEEEAQALTK
jgi:hypothetical protein